MPGLTTQMIAKDGTGAVVTAGLTWSSQDTTIATVSPTGLVTAAGLGGTRVTASTGTATASATITVQQPADGSTSITACRSILAPGRYQVVADLNGAPCLSVAGVTGVEIDCGDHHLGPIIISSVSHATVTNCHVTGNVDLTDASDVTVTNSSTMNGFFRATRGSGVTLHNNSVTLGLAHLGRMNINMFGSVAGNLLQGNDFGTELGPKLSPLSAFVDGGGNVCAPPEAELSNFDCGSSASARARRGPR